MSRFPIRSSRRVVVRRQPIRNMMLDGGGASGNGDRGALQHAAQRTSNPYYSNNFLYRWQEYTRWYMTSWEARKIIDIPVDDALRLPFPYRSLSQSKDRQPSDTLDSADNSPAHTRLRSL